MAGFGAYIDKTGGFDRDDFMASKEFKEAAKNFFIYDLLKNMRVSACS